MLRNYHNQNHNFHFQYGRFCSGLSTRAQLSFITSNSSFTDGVRKCNPQSNVISYQTETTTIIGAENHHFENTSETVNDNIYTTPGHLTLTTSASFLSCEWRNCEAQNGGGIYISTGNTLTLTVTKGLFYSCKASPNQGGGIYIKEIKTLTVVDSLFYKCIAEAHDNYGGGGIQMWNIQEPFIIETTSFISCESGNDGGGVATSIDPTWQEISISHSLFLQCKGTSTNPEYISDGGSLMIGNSNAAICCSNTLFADSHSTSRGGGITCMINSHSQFIPSIPLFSFCFFKNNSAKTNPGNDIYIEGWKPTNPFLHCFSLTPTKRVYPNGNDDNWLALRIT